MTVNFTYNLDVLANPLRASTAAAAPILAVFFGLGAFYRWIHCHAQGGDCGAIVTRRPKTLLDWKASR